MAVGIIQFGEFELDFDRFVLLRGGRPVKLEKIPMELLMLLALKEGHLVTRKAIIEHLWGKDTFLDTEHGINTAVRKIRLVLKDDPDRPRFVQTVTGKGYRFVAEVSRRERIDHQSVENPPAAPFTIAEPFPPTAAGAEAKEPGPLDRRTTRPILVALIAALALVSIAYFGRRAFRPAEKPSHLVMLAVLPFENLSGDSSQDYLSDGLTEELIAQLGTLSPEAMGVIARTTSMAYKHTAKSVHEIGQELNADYVLESSLRREGSRLRITTQLVRTRDQTHVWAQSYDRQIDDSIGLQEEVARAVANQVEVKLSPRFANLSARPHSDPQATEAYLRGRYFFNQFTADGYRKGITYFKDAIARDPNFAEAWAGLSVCYRFLEVTDTISPTEGSPYLAEAARRAVSVGEGSAESHSAMASAYMDGYDWPNAEKELLLAIALDPSFSDTHRIYAALLNAQLRHQEARQQIEEAMRYDPLSLPNNAEIVRTYYYARDYDGAITAGQKALQLDPTYYRTHFWLARVYSQLPKSDKAVAEAKIVLEANPASNLALTESAYSLAVAGHTEEARHILHQLEQRARTGFVPAYNLAVIHISLEDDEDALRLLEQAYDEHDWALLVAAVEPRLDPLREFPRFRALVAKLRLPE